MPGQAIGYVRVSSSGQNPIRQLDGIALDKIFTEEISGKDVNRPALENLKQFVREGDIVFVHSMDRLARNLDDLRQLVRYLTNKGVKINFVKENLTFSGDDTPLANLLLSIMGAFAEFERSLIRERQLEGIAIAKKRGVYKGRKRSLSDNDISEIQRRAISGEQKSKIARDFKISRETLYKYLRQIPN